MKDVIFSGEYNYKQRNTTYPEFKIRDSLGNHVATIRRNVLYSGKFGSVRVYLDHTLNNGTTSTDWVFHTDYRYGAKSDKLEYVVSPAAGVSDVSNFLFQIRNGTSYYSIEMIGTNGYNVQTDTQIEADLLAHFGTIGDIEAFDVYLIDSDNSLILATYKAFASAIKLAWTRFYNFVNLFNPNKTEREDLWKWGDILDSHRYAKLSIDASSFTVSSVVYTETTTLPSDIVSNIASVHVTSVGGLAVLSVGQDVRKSTGEYLGTIKVVTSDFSVELYNNAVSTYTWRGGNNRF
jgi:hypothetical protein